MKRTPVYVAHCLSAPTAEGMAENRERASRWLCWLSERYLVAPVASWITLGKYWPETPERRAHGLAIDKVLVELCGILIAVGPRFSEGMRTEAGWAKTVVDLTGLCPDSPDHSLQLWNVGAKLSHDVLAIIDTRIAAAGIAKAP